MGDPALYYALETQTMSTFPKDGIDEATVAHELAHQWFGDAVTVAQWRDLWLAEGFATYLEFLWDYRGDRGALDAAFNRLYAYAVQNKIGPAVVSFPRTYSPTTPTTGAHSRCRRCDSTSATRRSLPPSNRST